MKGSPQRSVAVVYLRNPSTSPRVRTWDFKNVRAPDPIPFSIETLNRVDAFDEPASERKPNSMRNFHGKKAALSWNPSLDYVNLG